MPDFTARLGALLLALALYAGPTAAVAQSEPAKPTLEQRRSEAEAAFDAAIKASQHGPSDTVLADQARLHIPEHAVWVPQAPAARVLRAWGNTINRDMLGMVIGRTGQHTWAGIVSYTNAGYVKDDEARDLDPAAILQNLREGTDRDNEDRVARGFPALQLGDWLQKPAYDGTAKRLVWAFPLSDKGNTAAIPTVNYNTRELGRYGYISLNMLTDPENFAADKAVADSLLRGMIYLPGKSYADFNPGTDHIAEYGLAALIGVVALKKLGLIALASVFVLKFAKLGAVLVVGAAAAVRRFLRRAPPTA
jgi:uncharacterized membrane-anchored protein